MPYNLSRFGFGDMMDCRGRIRELFADDPPTLEAAAERSVEFFRRELVDERGQPACALVRFFKTHPYRDLPEGLQAVVREASPEAVSIPDLRCLTLVATRGDEEDWNSRLTSRGHRAIPLMSVEMVQQAPMIAQLITQLGFPSQTSFAHHARCSSTRTDHPQRLLRAAGAREPPHRCAGRVRGPLRHSVGPWFRRVASSGDLFAVILFSKVAIPPDAADQFPRGRPESEDRDPAVRKEDALPRSVIHVDGQPAVELRARRKAGLCAQTARRERGGSGSKDGRFAEGQAFDHRHGKSTDERVARPGLVNRGDVMTREKHFLRSGDEEVARAASFEHDPLRADRQQSHSRLAGRFHVADVDGGQRRCFRRVGFDDRAAEKIARKRADRRCIEDQARRRSAYQTNRVLDDAEGNLELHEHDARRGEQWCCGVDGIQAQRCVRARKHDDLFLADLVPQQDDRAWVVSCSRVTCSTATRSATRLVTRDRPAPSSPTHPNSATSPPSRAAATASLAAFPPIPRYIAAAVTHVPGDGNVRIRSTTSSRMPPTLTIQCTTQS